MGGVVPRLRRDRPRTAGAGRGRTVEPWRRRRVSRRGREHPTHLRDRGRRLGRLLRPHRRTTAPAALPHGRRLPVRRPALLLPPRRIPRRVTPTPRRSRETRNFFALPPAPDGPSPLTRPGATDRAPSRGSNFAVDRAPKDTCLRHMLETHAGEKHMATDTCPAEGHMLRTQAHRRKTPATDTWPQRHRLRRSGKRAGRALDRTERRIEPLRVVAERIEPHNARRSALSGTGPRRGRGFDSNSLK